jgi:hypothetical protein
MTFQPLLPGPILAVVAAALALARLVALWRVLASAGSRRRRAVLRWTGVTLVVLLLIIATTRPALLNDNRQDATPTAGADLNVFLVVDRSADSNIDDYGNDEPRIAGMRDDIATVIKQYPAARFALITFDSKASLDWPLSEDVWSLRPTIAALGSRNAGPNTNAAAADNVLRYQLIQATQQYPGSRNVVLYFGSGAPGSQAPQDDFNLTRGTVSGGAVLGYGRSDAIDEVELRRLAAQLDIPYVHRDRGQSFRLDLPDSPHRVEADRIELYWLPALLAAGLLLAEIYLSVREFRRGRIARRDLAS